jgi:hypothetical protein
MAEGHPEIPTGLEWHLRLIVFSGVNNIPKNGTIYTLRSKKCAKLKI